MPKYNPHRFRLERAKELDTLARILDRTGICSDCTPLHQAADECRQPSADRWRYSLERLIFRIRDTKNAIPSKVYDVTLDLSIFLTGHCKDDGEIRDPLNALEFNMVITGKHDKNGETRSVLCSWHLDRDLPAAPGGTHEFIHPVYHFQHGGRNMWGLGNDFGDSLILESPRLAHPPMDAILGIDFVLTNYIKSSELEFRQENDYKNLLRSAQAIMWKPYARALTFAWEPGPIQSEWPFILPWPQLVDRAERN
jgi:hypothetical protein